MTPLILLWAALGALAEDSEFAGAQAPPAEEEALEKPETTLSAELGGALASGNASFYTVNAGLTFGHQWKRNKLSAVAGANVGAAVPDADESGNIDDAERQLGLQENARRVLGEARYDRFVSDHDSVYVLAGAFHDVFAGYDLRSHEQIGYSRRLVKTDPTELRGELGFDYAQELYVDGVDPGYQDIYAARLLLALSHAFSDQVGFSDTFEVYENVLTPEDVRLLNTFTFSSAISSNLSLKLSHALIFDNVPVEGFQKLDQTTLVTLVATIL